MFRKFLVTAGLFFTLVTLLAFYSPAGADRGTSLEPTILRVQLRDSEPSIDGILERLAPLRGAIELVSLDPRTNQLTLRFRPDRTTPEAIAHLLGTDLKDGGAGE